jgi:hypothetical protein
MKIKPLRYVIQRTNGNRWHTVKSYNYEEWEYRVVSRVMEKLVGRYAGHFRIFLMPFNVLAESTL